MPPLDWIVLVDLRDDILQEDLTFRFETSEGALKAVHGWLREGHVARVTIIGTPGGTKELHEVFPLGGVKRFEIRYQPLSRPS